MTDLDENTNPPKLSEPARGELEIHLAEYAALSEFQRDAKSGFVRLAIYHNTGIVVAIGWALTHFDSSKDLVSSLSASGYLLPVLFLFPIVNAVLIVACAYQVYSFYCVARHFLLLRKRLSELVSADVLAYEDKFERLLGKEKELSIALDVVAAVMWFMIPVFLAFGMIVAIPFVLPIDSTAFRWAYGCGVVFSALAILYLVGVGTAMSLRGRETGPKGEG